MNRRRWGLGPMWPLPCLALVGVLWLMPANTSAPTGGGGSSPVTITHPTN